ncbi:MAG TPA: 1-(5-phosphoribosyl)-5-[(5-phosphoribosylamino)methylideneamino]imidazole-4-carboxamide isomerase [Acidobacteriota bacterium]|jgi:phosphoribosylformimino-5-aminoimidazole carboxamide ribotide isomerase
MDLYPAIDLLGGKCVRLTRGDFKQVTVYSDDPLQTASEFAAAGARWLHVVDLDGARSGLQANLALVQQIAKIPGIKLQMGGGLRTGASVRKALQWGVSRCVLGTAALDRELLGKLGDEFGDKLAVGVDVEGGTVRVSGWTRDSGVTVEDFLAAMKEVSLRYVMVTDIVRDGTLAGPNVSLLKDVVKRGFQVLASGGVSSLADLELLAKELPQLEGVIVGKAIYEKIFTVSEALQCLKSASR